MNSFNGSEKSKQPTFQSESFRIRWIRFLSLTAVLCIIWLVILPRAAEIPRLQSEIKFLEQRKIDPSAMFYSDLETIEQTVQSIDQFHQENPDDLW
ncbi:hypothetical protein [uncultured Gimesia sp.]|uniref:hypothetical protein n=1 Tax=uncultured Gimesia sp. TaxID=1678688 RepID=UPI0026168708|nr:hypothetical protein [uncultured Gimesia sp.]